MAGRRPKPLKIHELNGNPSHFSQADLKGAEQPQPELTRPEMPKGMPKAARREWRKIVPELEKIGVLSIVDGRALAEYCRAAALIEQAQKEIDKHGLVFVTHFEDKDENIITGDIKQNPACAVLATQQKVMKAFLIEFGLTPASRSKLKIEKKNDKDPMEAFLAGKRSPVPFKTPEPVKPEEMAGSEEDES